MVILDCNNFWSPAGGGVRRYHLEKIEFYKRHPEVTYWFLMSSDRDEVEQLTDNVRIRHIRAPQIPGTAEYRLLFHRHRLHRALAEIRPDVIEIGSPYVLPWLVPKALKGLGPARLFGFWHADFPVTYINRGLAKLHPALGGLGERLAWAYARRCYGEFETIFVGSRAVADQLAANGLSNTTWVPLGVDAEMFHPDKADPALTEQLRAGRPDRLTIFFPHRFCEEKGVLTLLRAYPLIAERLGYEPALVFCGSGPRQDKVEAAAASYEHVQCLGYLDGREEMARYFASCDLGLALSAWETFGLTILESLASGQILVGANERAAWEHVVGSGAGEVVPPADPEALAAAVTELWLRGDRAQLKANARRYAEQFSWDRCFELELAEYRRAVHPG